MSSASKAVRNFAVQVFRFSAAVFAQCVPQKHWYRTLLSLCRIQAFILRSFVAISPYRNDSRKHVLVAWLLNSWLHHLARLKRPFSIPIKVSGLEVVLDGLKSRTGLVICSGHLPLVYALLRPLADVNAPPDAVASSRRELVDGKFPLWGTAAGVPAITPSGTALVKVRNILRKGGCLAALIDRYLHDPADLRLFQVIRLSGAQIVFSVVQLMPDGTIFVEFLTAPHPFCENDDSILSNLSVLKKRIDAILHLTGDEFSTGTVLIPTPEIRTAEADPAVGLSKRNL